MSTALKRRILLDGKPMRFLGRGLYAQRGVRLSIRTVREAAGKTQVDVATVTGMDQSDVSRLEARTDFEDCQVSTLRRYVAALGGDLQLVAAFGAHRIILSGSHPTSVDDSTLKRKHRKRS